jgi:hypothetical protein
MAGLLSPKMSVSDFENGYWYTNDLKVFAKSIGVENAGKLRKNELERAIVHFLLNGTVTRHGSNPGTRAKPAASKKGASDLERGLELGMRIENYTSRRETKDFIVAAARRLEPDLRVKSGVWYRLNRWREEQLRSGRPLTYRQLVEEFIRLNTLGEFERIPHGRYINFVADFLAKERGGTRAEAVLAWHELKRLEVPKTYEEYASWKSKTRGQGAVSKSRKT